MIDPAYVRLMARYNRWQNVSLYDAAETLSDNERRRDRSAFFKSIHGTFNHLLWADSVWMSRFRGGPTPTVKISDSASFIDDWAAMKGARAECDEEILMWADGLDAAALSSDLTWRPASRDVDMTTPRWFAVAHMFNHQTHHRGQLHAMLTSAGATPQDTDLILMRR